VIPVPIANVPVALRLEVLRRDDQDQQPEADQM